MRLLLLRSGVPSSKHHCANACTFENLLHNKGSVLKATKRILCPYFWPHQGLSLHRKVVNYHFLWHQNFRDAFSRMFAPVPRHLFGQSSNFLSDSASSHRKRTCGVSRPCSVWSSSWYDKSIGREGEQLGTGITGLPLPLNVFGFLFFFNKWNHNRQTSWVSITEICYCVLDNSSLHLLLFSFVTTYLTFHTTTIQGRTYLDIWLLIIPA